MEKTIERRIEDAVSALRGGSIKDGARDVLQQMALTLFRRTR